MAVNFVDLKAQYANLDMGVLFEELEHIITNGKFVGGEALDTFEKNFADYHGTDHAIGVGSGTDALIFALAGLGIGPGDEVIVPANTFIATALAVTHVGATPVFCDVNPLTYNMDSTFESVVTENTKAVIPVHLYGNPADMENIVRIANRLGIYVIEDCAQAIGATFQGQKVGTFGDAGCYSFYPAKNLGGLGQGGAIVTNNEAIAAKARCLGNVGRTDGTWYEYSEVGYNSRLDAINAVFLNTCLQHIDFWNKNRRSIANAYAKELEGLEEVTLPFVDSRNVAVYHLYELKLKSQEARDGLQAHLQSKDIACALHYPVPCHKQAVYPEYNELTFGMVDSLAATLLSLPMHPFMKRLEITEVCDAIKEYFA